MVLLAQLALPFFKSAPVIGVIIIKKTTRYLYRVVLIKNNVTIELTNNVPLIDAERIADAWRVKLKHGLKK